MSELQMILVLVDGTQLSKKNAKGEYILDDCNSKFGTLV